MSNAMTDTLSVIRDIRRFHVFDVVDIIVMTVLWMSFEWLVRFFAMIVRLRAFIIILFVLQIVLLRYRLKRSLQLLVFLICVFV